MISPEDMSLNVAGVTHLKEVCDPLGANLVLAASGSPGPKHFQLFLRLLDPSSGQPLREKKLTCALAKITSLPGKAVQAAASLLDVSHYVKSDKRAKLGTQSAAAFTAFQSAETLMKQPNDSGLDAAIEQYKQATELDPRYAIAHARLAVAYVRLYGNSAKPPKRLTSLLETVRLRYRSILTLRMGISLWRRSLTRLETSRQHWMRRQGAFTRSRQRTNIGLAGADVHSSESVGGRGEDTSQSA